MIEVSKIVEHNCDNVNTDNKIVCLGDKIVNKNVNDVKLWYLRLDHLPFQSLKNLYPNLNIKYVHDDYFCTICLAAKLTR